MRLADLDIEYKGYRIKSVETSSPDHFQIGVFDSGGEIAAGFSFQPFPMVSVDMQDETIQDCIEHHKKTIDEEAA